MEIFLYQPGKVGSMAVKAALEDQGVAVYHAHFLGVESLIESLNYLLGEDPPEESDESLAVVCQNIRATQVFLRRRKRGDTIKIITGVRDPLNWYVSHVIHHFPELYPNIIAWCEANGHTKTGDIVDNVRVFAECVFNRVSKCRNLIDTKAFASEVYENPDQIELYEHIREQCHDLRSSISWLDNQLYFMTGLDIYETPFGDAWQVYDGEKCQIFLYKYECLAQSMHAMAQFVGLEELWLEQVNISNEKKFGKEVKQAFHELYLPGEIWQNLRLSRFCRYFDYPQTHQIVGTKMRQTVDV